MAKEWFQHDYGTRNKKKLAVLIHEEGARGYGLFWIIVEMLYEDRRKKMELDQSTYLAIKKESGDEIEKIKEFINKGIAVYKVFKKVGKSCFTTERVLENDKFRRKISEQNRSAGIRSSELKKKKSTPVEPPSTPVEQNSTSGNKGEESTVQESKGEERESTTEAKIPDPVVADPLPGTEARAPDLSKSNLCRQPNIPTKQQVWEFFVGAGGTKEQAKSFFDKHDATGWYSDGSPIVNFRALANKFIDTWRRNDQEKAKKNSPPSPGGPILKNLV